STSVQEQLDEQQRVVLEQATIADDELSRRVERQSTADVSDMRAENDSMNNESHVTEDVSVFHALLSGPASVGSQDSRVLTSLRGSVASSPSAEAPRDQLVSIHGRIEDTPLNEFVQNNELLSCAFPWLFPRGLADSTRLSKRVLSRLLRFYDGRFARDRGFLFLMFNQLQRFEASRVTTLRVSADEEQSNRFIDLINSRDFDSRLAEAVSDPNGSVAKTLLRDIDPMIQKSAGMVPWSPMERKRCTSYLYALTHLFGSASFFTSHSPSLIDNPLAIRRALLQEGTVDVSAPEFQWENHLGSLRERSILLGENPVAEGLVFDAFTRALNEHVLQLSDTETTRRAPLLRERSAGAFGKISAHFAVVEAQRSGAPHCHRLIWGGLSPENIQSVVADEEQRQSIRTVLDTLVQGALPEELHNERRLRDQEARRRREAHEAPPTPQPRVGLQRAVNPDESVLEYAQGIAKRVNVHRHTQACKKPPNEERCRFGFKRRVLQETSFSQICLEGEGEEVYVQAIDSIESNPIRSSFFYEDPLPPEDRRLIVMDVARPLEPDAYTVEFNPTNIACARCNVCDSNCGSSVESKAALFYLIKYITKNPTELSMSLSLIYAARKEMLLYPSIAEDAGSAQRNAKYLLTKICNRLAGMEEYSATLVAQALLGAPSFYTSHSFWYCYIWSAVKYVKESHSLPSDLNTMAQGRDEEVDEDEEEKEEEKVEADLMRQETSLVENPSSLDNTTLLNLDSADVEDLQELGGSLWTDR
ncbi:MAG: hypothetical protein AAGM67_03480, partial [Bacteroidota bacterium]